MDKPTIFIDESGTLPDPHDQIIIVAAVGVKDLRKLEQTFKSIKKKRARSEKSFELKFYKAGTNTKKLFFKELAEQTLTIFILTVNKMGRKIPDSPDHFAILCGLLISEVMHFYPQIQKIIFDRHFHRKNDEEKFNSTLINFINNSDFQIQHVDSKNNILVNVADMIAGAVLSKETGKDVSFYEIIKDKITSETKLNWPEAKRRLLKQK